jgi:hypothetical protein
MGVDNVDRRLLPAFEASREQERARRELLPPEWINAGPDAGSALGELFEDVLERARARVRMQRAALGDELDSAV